MNKPSFVVTGDSITVIVDGKVHRVKASAPNFTMLRNAIFNEQWQKAVEYLDVDKVLNVWSSGAFSVSADGKALLNGAELPTVLTEKIKNMLKEQLNPEPVFKFWSKLQSNPNPLSVAQLWPFLENKGIPLTEDGDFLAYKGVRHDYKDKHSNTYDNHPGTVNSMDRDLVSDNPDVHCDPGFHVGALEYARGFGEKVVICQVNPADVVSVPNDHECQKMRVCKYKVVGLHDDNDTYLPDTVLEDEDLPKLDCGNNNECDDVDCDGLDCIFDSGEGDGFICDDEKSDCGNCGDECDNCDNCGQEENLAEHEVYVNPDDERKEYQILFKKMDKAPVNELMGFTLDQLRKYAGNHVGIVRASKIPGGKTALVRKIKRAR